MVHVSAWRWQYLELLIVVVFVVLILIVNVVRQYYTSTCGLPNTNIEVLYYSDYYDGWKPPSWFVHFMFIATYATVRPY